MAEPPLRDRPLAAPKLDETVHTGNDKADTPDRYGEWLADDARIWRVYGQLAKEDDKEKAQRWSGGLNNLAVFAALFSGITTAFLIESQNDLKPDFAELAYRVQNATAHGHPYVEEAFVVPGQARLVNCLWITSLLLSLSAALIAIMGQDWVEMYLDQPVCNPRQWAEIRSFRLNGVRRWYMPGVIATAPVLLHASLFLFGIGLVIFMISDVITQNLCIALCAVIAFLYAVTMFSPVLWSSSPFRSPATLLVRQWICATFQRKGDDDGSLPENTIIHCIARRVAAVHRWIQNCLSVHWAAFDIALEICGPHVLTGCKAVFRRRSPWNDSDHGDPRRPSRAAHDPEIAAPASVQWDAPPGRLPHFFSSFQTMLSRILARYAANVSDGWKAFRQLFSVAFHRYGSPALGGIRTYYTGFRMVFSCMLNNSRPDFSNGWLDICEKPAPALMADSLFWLSSASSSPEVTQLVVAGLCDHVLGPTIAKHANARNLTEKLYQYADGHWEHMSVLDLSRYIIMSANAGRRDWPDRVKQRFKGIIGADDPLPQDTLLALVHLTSVFQDEPLIVLHKSLWHHSPEYGPNRFNRLCARIPDRNSITFPTIASIAAGLRLDLVGDMAPVMIILLLMNKWRDVLPTDLRPVEQVLRGMLHKKVMEETNKLTTLCACLDRPIDNILHILIASISYDFDWAISVHSTRDLALHLARAASGPGNYHSCLAAMFGNSNPSITRAAWSGLPVHVIESALRLTCSYAVRGCHADMRPMVTRMITRCISPPFPLLAGNVSAQALLSHRGLLFQLVDAMSKDRALPDDLFRSVLKSGALAGLAACMREDPRNIDRGPSLLWILAAIAQWITTQSDVEDRRKLFELFTGPQTNPGASDSAVWDLVEAFGTVLEATADLMVLGAFGVPCIMLVLTMTDLRHMFPGPERTLWVDIARKFGANKNRFEPGKWAKMRKLVEDGTGIDPEKCDTGNRSHGAGSAVQGDDSASDSSSQTMEPTNDSADDDTPAQEVPQLACTAAGATPEAGI